MAQRETEALNENDKMPFGKHKGKTMVNVPAEYLLYIFDMPWIEDWPRVFKYIDDNFDAILKEQTETRKNK